MYDIIIIGGGMAGMTACLYALRNNKKVLIFEKETIGGQIAESPKVENYPTIKSVSGATLADELFTQITELGAELEIDEVKKIEKKGKTFTLTTDYGQYECLSVIIATGSKHRHLGLENEEKFLGKGVYYCAMCDGPFFKGQEVCLIGDANAALSYALMLSSYCKKVKIFTLFDHFFGEKSVIEQVKHTPNIEITHEVKAVEFVGKDTLSQVVFEKKDGSRFSVDTHAVFVAIGQQPDNKIFEHLVDLDKAGYVVADENCMTKTPGLFVAGDCRTKKVRQVVTAMGDGATATINACNYLSSIGE